MLSMIKVLILGDTFVIEILFSLLAMRRPFKSHSKVIGTSPFVVMHWIDWVSPGFDAFESPPKVKGTIWGGTV